MPKKNCPNRRQPALVVFYLYQLRLHTIMYKTISGHICMWEEFIYTYGMVADAVNSAD